jgi:hypothetical protein
MCATPRSAMRIGTPLEAATTVWAISSLVRRRPTPVTRYSEPPLTRKPAETLSFDAASACLT